MVTILSARLALAAAGVLLLSSGAFSQDWHSKRAVPRRGLIVENSTGKVIHNIFTEAPREGARMRDYLGRQMIYDRQKAYLSIDPPDHACVTDIYFVLDDRQILKEASIDVCGGKTLKLEVSPSRNLEPRSYT